MFTSFPGKSPKRQNSPLDVNTPLFTFQPEVITREGGLRYATWPINPTGRQMARGLQAFGFQINQIEGEYRLLLDGEADALLLSLYDVIANLRWRTPYRQLVLLDEAANQGDGRYV